MHRGNGRPVYPGAAGRTFQKTHTGYRFYEMDLGPAG